VVIDFIIIQTVDTRSD